MWILFFGKADDTGCGKFSGDAFKTVVPVDVALDVPRQSQRQREEQKGKSSTDQQQFAAILFRSFCQIEPDERQQEHQQRTDYPLATAVKGEFLRKIHFEVAQQYRNQHHDRQKQQYDRTDSGKTVEPHSGAFPVLSDGVEELKQYHHCRGNGN